VSAPSAERNFVELLPLLLIFAVMMLPLLFMSNRQKKAQQKQLELVRRLGVGDEVRTHSGFFGLIVEAYDDVVVLESEDGTQTKWARQAIAQAVPPAEHEAAEDDAVESGTSANPADGDFPGVTVSDDTPRDEGPRRDRL
jgi:preprotein translocase subunit YajC